MKCHTLPVLDLWYLSAANLNLLAVAVPLTVSVKALHDTGNILSSLALARKIGKDRESRSMGKCFDRETEGT